MRLKEQNQSSQDLMYDILMTFQSYKGFILGDQGADSGGKGKSKWAEKRWRELFFEPFFSHPFRLSPAPTICSWVFEDGRVFLKNIISYCLQHRRHLEFQKATHMRILFLSRHFSPIRHGYVTEENWPRGTMHQDWASEITGSPRLHGICWSKPDLPFLDI